jgi:hypothetical protein
MHTGKGMIFEQLLDEETRTKNEGRGMKNLIRESDMALK